MDDFVLFLFVREGTALSGDEQRCVKPGPESASAGLVFFGESESALCFFQVGLHEEHNLIKTLKEKKKTRFGVCLEYNFVVLVYFINCKSFKMIK